MSASPEETSGAPSSEDQELLRRIGEISGQYPERKFFFFLKASLGRINRFKNPPSQRPQPWNKYVVGESTKSPSSHRSSPYPLRSSRHTRPVSHRHRSLVINNNGNNSSTEEDSRRSQSQGWVTKRDRHVQLINSSILDQETQARSKAMEETRRQKAVKRDERERQKIHEYLNARQTSTHDTSSATAIHEVVIDGLKFHVLQGGSKLARVRGEGFRASPLQTKFRLKTTGPTDSTSSTPKQVVVGGVPFMRSKNGNLYRAGVVKVKR